MKNHNLSIRFLSLFLTLLLLAAAYGSVCAEETVSFTDAAEFAFSESLGDFYKREACSIRAVYSITLPEETSVVHEAVLQSYSDYSDILLFEFGYCNILPIVESCFICVGTSKLDGSFVILPAPSVIFGRTYDFNAFNNVTIMPVT